MKIQIVDKEKRDLIKTDIRAVDLPALTISPYLVIDERLFKVDHKETVFVKPKFNPHSDCDAYLIIKGYEVVEQVDDRLLKN